MNEIQHNDEISLKYFLFLVKSWWELLIINIRFILILALIGGALGGFIAKRSETQYISDFSLIVEGESGGKANQYMRIAESFGLGLGEGSSNLLTIENIKSLAFSKKIIYDALLSEININGKQMLLINYYINQFDVLKRFKSIIKNPTDFKIQKVQPFESSINEEIILNHVFRGLQKKAISISSPEATSLLEIKIQSSDEQFSFWFSKCLSNSLYDFFITKIKKVEDSALKQIQLKCDSIEVVLKIKEQLLAELADKSLLTVKSAGRLNEMRVSRELNILNAMYVVNVKNLEIAKYSATNEKKVFDILDEPVLPLIKSSRSLPGFIVLLGGVFGFLALVFVLVKNEFKKLT